MIFDRYVPSEGMNYYITLEKNDQMQLGSKNHFELEGNEKISYIEGNLSVNDIIINNSSKIENHEAAAKGNTNNNEMDLTDHKIFISPYNELASRHLNEDIENNKQFSLHYVSHLLQKKDKISDNDLKVLNLSGNYVNIVEKMRKESKLTTIREESEIPLIPSNQIQELFIPDSLSDLHKHDMSILEERKQESMQTQPSVVCAGAIHLAEAFKDDNPISDETRELPETSGNWGTLPPAAVVSSIDTVTHILFPDTRQKYGQIWEVKHDQSLDNINSMVTGDLGPPYKVLKISERSNGASKYLDKVSVTSKRLNKNINKMGSVEEVEYEFFLGDNEVVEKKKKKNNLFIAPSVHYGISETHDVKSFLSDIPEESYSEDILDASQLEPDEPSEYANDICNDNGQEDDLQSLIEE